MTGCAGVTVAESPPTVRSSCPIVTGVVCECAEKTAAKKNAHKRQRDTLRFDIATPYDIRTPAQSIPLTSYVQRGPVSPDHVHETPMNLLLFLLWPNVARKVGARSMQRWSGTLIQKQIVVKKNKSSNFEKVS